LVSLGKGGKKSTLDAIKNNSHQNMAALFLSVKKRKESI
jgi:hypothetical protein